MASRATKRAAEKDNTEAEEKSKSSYLGRFKIPKITFKSFGSTQNSNDDDENQRGRNRTRNSARKRAVSASPTGDKLSLKDFPSNVLNLFKIRRRAVSVEKTVPMRPIRKPGPVGKIWVKIYDDILFMDDISESEEPILGYSGFPAKVPDALPLPRAPTPPPIRVKKLAKMQEEFEFKRSQELFDSQNKENADPQALESEYKETVQFKSKISPKVGLRKNRDLHRFKLKMFKRPPTPISAVNRNKSAMDDDYIIPQKLKEEPEVSPSIMTSETEEVTPLKPKRGKKLYETIPAHKKENEIVNAVEVEKMDTDQKEANTSGEILSEEKCKLDEDKSKLEDIEFNKKNEWEEKGGSTEKMEVSKEEIRGIEEDSQKMVVDVNKKGAEVMEINKETVDEEKEEKRGSFPIYAKIKKTAVEDAPPTIPPKKQKILDEKVHETCYDILPPRPPRTSKLRRTRSHLSDNSYRSKFEEKSTLPGKNFKRENVFRCVQERPLPAPPRKKRIEEANRRKSQLVPPIPPPKANKRLNKSYSEIEHQVISYPKSLKENELGNNNASAIKIFDKNESCSVISNFSASGCDNRNSELNSEINVNLKNIENSFHTLDNVIKSIQKYTSCRSLVDIGLNDDANGEKCGKNSDNKSSEFARNFTIAANECVENKIDKGNCNEKNDKSEMENKKENKNTDFSSKQSTSTEIPESTSANVIETRQQSGDLTFDKTALASDSKSADVEGRPSQTHSSISGEKDLTKIKPASEFSDPKLTEIADRLEDIRSELANVSSTHAIDLDASFN